jgi:meso-butanediol dehydrogenase/(S,S)-butanediol dehydrogenase/diacetyl reductase
VGILEGKVALISRTGGGQGRAAALVFAREGARVFGCDVNEAGAKETVDMVRAAGGAPIDIGSIQSSVPGLGDIVRSPA